jgi:hypothetical protein
MANNFFISYLLNQVPRANRARTVGTLNARDVPSVPHQS